MMKTRRRFKQATTLHDRLAIFEKEMRDRASSLPPGDERQELLTKARQADAASQFDHLISLQAPTPKS
jgi:hypothetical protein